MPAENVNQTYTTIISGALDFRLPNWGRAFWQDPIDGQLFLAYVSGNSQLNFTTSSTTGVTWTVPQYIGPVDDFITHANFDTFMDPRGHVHCAFRTRNLNSYRILGKIAGGGWSNASGNIVHFQLAGDSGLVKGCQASVTVIDNDPGGVGLAGPYPRVIVYSKASGVVGNADRIVAYHQPYPFNSTFTTSDVGPCGSSGGYPVPINRGVFNSQEVMFLDASSTVTTARFIKQYTQAFGSWSANNTLSVATNRNPFYENMAFGSGTRIDNNGFALIASASGQDYYSTSNGFIRHATEIPVLQAGTNTYNWRESFPSGIFGIQYPSGTNCDFSFNDAGKTILYFQAYSRDGSQGINRFIGDYTIAGTSGTYNWGPLTNSASGIRYFAPAGRYNSGSVNNKAHIIKFKALRHPTMPNQGVAKKEMVVTCTYLPGSISGMMLSSWNIKDSVELADPLPFPSFLQNLNDTPTFSGVWQSGGFSASANNLFDKNVNTTSSVNTSAAGGGFVSVAFKDIVKITEIEIWKNFAGGGWGTVTVSGSFDGNSWNNVFSATDSATGFDSCIISANRNIGHATVITDQLIGEYLDAPIIAKYVRLHFTGGASAMRIDDIIFRGPGSTLRTYSSGLFDNFFPPQLFEENWKVKGHIEEFVGRQGTLPINFFTSGNFEWTIDASGNWRRDNALPSQIEFTQGDVVDSGIHADKTHGMFDSFAAVPRTTNQAGHSGVIFTSIYVDPKKETNRTVTFKYRTDMHPRDIFRFDTVRNNVMTNQLVVGTGAADIDYSSASATLNPGYYTLRWTYIRGSGSNSSSTGRVWLDRIEGLEGSPQPSVKGFIIGSRFQASGSIYGYIEGRGFSSIHGYIAGDKWTTNIYGYMRSAAMPDVITSIYGYIKPTNASMIYGYLLGSSGVNLMSIPTGSIYGIVGNKSGVFEHIYGYMRPMPASTIWGYVRGFEHVTPTGDDRIWGYVRANKPLGSIWGLVNGSGDNVGTEDIYGYVKGNIGDQAIHGYVKRPGPASSQGIYGYVAAGRPDQFIYGYVGRGVGVPTGSIYGYVLANKPNSSIWGYVGNSGALSQIYGHIQGELGSQYIHGYVKRPLATMSQIYGYVAGALVPSGTIHGYLKASSHPTGAIYGWMSGIGHPSSSINGWLMGISGTVSSRIYGYLNGDQGATSVIYGCMVGLYQSGINVCEQHLFLPLPTVNSGTIPTLYYDGMLI